MIEEMACIRKTYLSSEDQTEMKTFDCGVGRLLFLNYP